MEQEGNQQASVRIGHRLASIQNSAGEGIQDTYSDEGILHRGKFLGCKSPQEMRTHLEELALWIWSLKDYIRSRLAKLGHDPNDVEQYVNGCQYLPLCADIANSTKHLELNRTRSGKSARLPQVYISHRTGLRREPGLTDETDTYYIFDDPSEVKYRAPVVDANGSPIGDAFDILPKGNEEWEKYFSANAFLLKT